MEQPGSDFADYAGFVPGLAISILVALILGGSIARRVGASRLVATLLILGLGAVLSATVTPSREALMGMPQISTGCDLSRIGPDQWSAYAQLDDTSLNVLLFIPLGMAIGLLPRTRPKAGLILGAIFLPIAIETFQLVAAPLGRACQSGDVFDNLMGLALGLGIGSAVGRIGQRA